jgi:hypothetical protein
MSISFNKLKTSVQISQGSNIIEDSLKELYYKLDLNYPKFFKMDNLCKLGVLGAELLVRENQEILKGKFDIGIILQNKSSSLDSDIKHQAKIDEDTVSPAVFVYTLPNIVIGEISIKHKWNSEGVFFVDKEIDYELLSQYSNILLKEARTKLNLIGWVDVFKNQLSLQFCFVESEITTDKLESLLG